MRVGLALGSGRQSSRVRAGGGHIRGSERARTAATRPDLIPSHPFEIPSGVAPGERMEAVREARRPGARNYGQRAPRHSLVRALSARVALSASIF